jgi:hypothetical protein
MIKSAQGDHRGALSDLEALYPLVRALAQHESFYHYLFNNDKAYELASLGEIEEARRAAAIALSAPVAGAYPEWQETGAFINDKVRLASKRRRTLFVPGKSGESQRPGPPPKRKPELLSERKEIDLSRYENLCVAFTDGQGRPLFTVDYSRDQHESPQASISVSGPAGDIQTGFTIFDLKI